MTFFQTAALASLLAVSLLEPLQASDDAIEAWSHFGGPGDDFRVAAAPKPWPSSGPEVLWQRDLGAGYSGIVADESQLFTLYRDGGDDVVVGLDARTGDLLWEHRYSAPTRDRNLVEFGRGPHATPLLLTDRVVTLGYTGVLKALDRTTGSPTWAVDLIEDLGGDVLPWGYSASPIFHDGSIIVLVGGPQGAVALDPASGDVRWRSEASTVSYSTPRVLAVHGREELLFFAKDALRSLDPRDGRSLWSHRIVNGYENHASNLLWDGELLWVASQQEAAGRALRLTGTDEPPELVWRNRKVRMHHWNGVLVDGVVYGSIGDGVQTLAAVELATGEIHWRDRAFGLVTAVHTDTGTLLLDGEGGLALTRLSREGLEVLARGEVTQERSWTAPAIVGRRLYVRDQQRIRAFDLGSE